MFRNYKQSVVVVAVAAVLGLIHTAHTLADSKQIARGKYVVTTSGCNDCHTPWKVGPAGPEPDYSRMLSGHPEQLVMPAAIRLADDSPWKVQVSGTNTAWSGPWGMSYTANLTPDPETGLGKWTLRNFKDTIRTGRHQGRGREILPPMPILMYKNFTDADLEAIFAYLRSIPAVKNRVPEPQSPTAALKPMMFSGAVIYVPDQQSGPKNLISQSQTKR